MMNIIEDAIIVNAFNNIITKGKYPEFGSPEVHCDKCMFHKVTCFPTNKNAVGCFHGWKKEGTDYTKKLRDLGDIKL